MKMEPICAYRSGLRLARQKHSGWQGAVVGSMQNNLYLTANEQSSFAEDRRGFLSLLLPE